MVAKYAELRKRLKEEGNWEALDKLPRNGSAVRLHNRCGLTGRPASEVRLPRGFPRPEDLYRQSAAAALGVGSRRDILRP